ncbi:hypothetical protein GCM10009784_29350 [Arthrobacter parietis]|uniref:D-glucuronyl C5-epimerase C-terminal domain-containing protein n=1 Tax=Arthrobacter parietis TaxID=271434 RepID=A0ABP5MRH5_9MICC
MVEISSGLGDGTNAANTYMTNEREVGLPPLQASRKQVWDYYQIEFLPNGYPGRRTNGELFAHPIYGPYVISDYTAQYHRTKDQVFLDAACKVADAAVEQMTSLGDSLAFVYSQEKTKVANKNGVFYSGLTQSRYIEVFSKLLLRPGTERFREPLHRVLTSLTIPIEDNGVARFTKNGGLIIEEYPSRLPDCTLNGWTTATCILMDFAARNDDEQAREIFNQSVRGLEDLMPLYDVPELANSRYRLTGPASLRLAATDTDVEVLDCQVVIPGSGTFAANLAGDPAGEIQKKGTVRVRDGASQAVGVSLSRLSWPEPNKILLRVDASKNGQLSVAIGDGEYDPLASWPRAESYRKVQELPVNKGKNCIEVAIPWACAELVAYPTNFRKTITGRQFNQYHWIHVDTLAKIVAETGSHVLRHYHDKWSEYPSMWPKMSAYKDDRLMLERFDAKKHK